jgi:hypothetical protein
MLHLMSIKGKFNMARIMDELKEEYGSEGQFKPAIMQNHLDSMRAVGLIEVTDAMLDAGNHLDMQYEITEFGMSRLDLLPAGWEKRS